MSFPSPACGERTTDSPRTRHTLGAKGVERRGDCPRYGGGRVALSCHDAGKLRVTNASTPRDGSKAHRRTYQRIANGTSNRVHCGDNM